MPEDEEQRLRRERVVFPVAHWFDEGRFQPISVGRLLYDASCRVAPDGNRLTEEQSVDLAMKTITTLVENEWFEIGRFEVEAQSFDRWSERPVDAVRRLRKLLSPGGAGPRGLGLRRTAEGDAVAVQILNELPAEEPKPTAEDAIALVNDAAVVVPDQRRIGEWLPVQVERTEHYAIVQYVCWDTESFRPWQVVLVREGDEWRWRSSGNGWDRDPAWHGRPIGREPLRKLGSGTMWREPKLRTLECRADRRVAQLRIVQRDEIMFRPVESAFGLVLLAFEGDAEVEVVPVDDDGEPVLDADGRPQRIVIEPPKEPEPRPRTTGG